MGNTVCECFSAWLLNNGYQAIVVVWLMSKEDGPLSAPVSFMGIPRANVLMEIRNFFRIIIRIKEAI